MKRKKTATMLCGSMTIVEVLRFMKTEQDAQLYAVRKDADAGWIKWVDKSTCYTLTADDLMSHDWCIMRGATE